jgi:Peptidase M15
MSTVVSEKKYPRLLAVKEFFQEYLLAESSPDLVKELQYILLSIGLYQGNIDGIPGLETKRALTEFKRVRYLGHPDLIGASTAASLLEEATNKHSVGEQARKPRLLSSGRMVLPDGKIVLGSDPVIPGIPLTWGEYSKNCTRVPTDKEVIDSALRIARLFGEIREKFGSPIGITSGYRPASVNKSVGGARYSRHMVGDALDVYPISGNMDNLLSVVRSSSCTGLGLGMRRGFIHIDCRPGVRVVFNY